MVILYANVLIKARFHFSLYSILKPTWLEFNDTVKFKIGYNVSNVVLETVTHKIGIQKNPIFFFMFL